LEVVPVAGLLLGGERSVTQPMEEAGLFSGRQFFV